MSKQSVRQRIAAIHGVLAEESGSALITKAKDGGVNLTVTGSDGKRATFWYKDEESAKQYVKSAGLSLKEEEEPEKETPEYAAEQHESLMNVINETVLLTEREDPVAYAKSKHAEFKKALARVQTKLKKLQSLADKYADHMAGKSTWEYSGDLGRCVESLTDVDATLEWVDY